MEREGKGVKVLSQYLIYYLTNTIEKHCRIRHHYFLFSYFLVEIFLHKLQIFSFRQSPGGNFSHFSFRWFSF